MDDLALYDYELPQELIARQPLPRRDDSRLLVVDRQAGSWEHRTVRDLPALLQPGDVLVLNDTRVLPARLLGQRVATGGKWEGLFLGEAPHKKWRLIGHARGKLRPGERIAIQPAHAAANGPLLLTLLECDADGTWLAEPAGPVDNTLELLHHVGTVPLPPYIQRTLATPEDWERYQTTYAVRPGAVAATTAGLHFTPELLAACTERGIDQVFVTLHVGLGTFRPISVSRLSQHQMHAEWCEISAEAVRRLTTARAGGGRIVAVGTTSVRTLESAAQTGELRPWSGETSLFIRPPYRFRAVDALMTNFHLPKSTLLVLVCAFAGRELIRTVYADAVRERYRFYSYGDAMLIV